MQIRVCIYAILYYVYHTINYDHSIHTTSCQVIPHHTITQHMPQFNLEPIYNPPNRASHLLLHTSTTSISLKLSTDPSLPASPHRNHAIPSHSLPIHPRQSIHPEASKASPNKFYASNAPLTSSLPSV